MTTHRLNRTALFPLLCALFLGLASPGAARANVCWGQSGDGVFKSSDAGATWAACANSGLSNLNLLSLTSDASGKLYVGTEDGVFVSVDGCGVWTAMNSGLPN